MKPNIHPEYVESQIVCACGAVYHTRSTKQNLRLGICAACHPFFTGQQKFVDTAGRVEKFTKRFGASKLTQERMSELQLCQWNGGSRARAGFKTILIGPEHPDFGQFCQGAGHGFGFNEQKVIECGRFLQAISGRTRASPDFREALHVNLVIDAVIASAANGTWQTVAAG